MEHGSVAALNDFVIVASNSDPSYFAIVKVLSSVDKLQNSVVLFLSPPKI
jgi:ABC-type tungstate transport system permease subunit